MERNWNWRQGISSRAESSQKILPGLDNRYILPLVHLPDHLEPSLTLNLKTDFETVRRDKVYEGVARQIERLILKKLQPGDKLPSERDLAESLGVSRSSIRDAIRSLQLMAMLEPRQDPGPILRHTPSH